MSGSSVGKSLWVFAAATAALAGQAFAQAPAAPAEATAGNAPEEIIVTATRRETRLQDVPVAVTAVTSELVQNAGIRDLQDLAGVAPALQFNVSENETSATARLRGIGTQGSNPGLESAVGIFIDGVYRARNGVALTDLGEIQQIEVLRGPQGTLFGRNTSAGLISVRTAGPDASAFGASGEATFGEFGEERFAGSLNVPLIEDQLAARIFAATAKRDGFFQNIRPNGQIVDTNTRDVWTVRGQLQWDPTPELSARLIVDYSERDENCCGAKIYNPELLNGARAQIFSGGTFVGASFPAAQQGIIARLGGFGAGGSSAALRSGSLEERFGFANRGDSQQLEDQGVSLEVNYDTPIGALTSVTAWRDWGFVQGQDTDFSGVDIAYRLPDGSSGFGFEIFTQELRLAGEAGRLDWLVGAFYADETLTRRDRTIVGDQFGAYFAAQSPVYNALLTPGVAGSGSNDRYEQEGRSIALFTHNIFQVTDRTDLTLGLRYTDEQKDFTATYNTLFNVAPLFAATAAGIAANPAALGLPAAAGPAIPAFANCNTAIQPSGATAALAPLVAALRTGYCLPFFRNDLDGVRKQSREEGEWSGVVSLRHSFTDDISAYASYSRGYKGGGFNLDRAIPNPGQAFTTAFEAEVVDSYEVGVKTSWLDGDLILNFAGYQADFENYQLNTFNGLQFQVSSVPEARTRGVETDWLWRTPLTGLSMQGGVSYTQAEYGEDLGNFVARTANPINGEPTNARLPGARMTNAPLWTVTNAATYRQPLFNERAMGLAHVDFRYVSSQSTASDLEVSKVQPAYTLWNARLGLSTADERFGVELWGKNLTDENYAQIMFNAFAQGTTRGAFLGDPRSFGITFKAQY